MTEARSASKCSTWARTRAQVDARATSKNDAPTTRAAVTVRRRVGHTPQVHLHQDLRTLEYGEGESLQTGLSHPTLLPLRQDRRQHLHNPCVQQRPGLGAEDVQG